MALRIEPGQIPIGLHDKLNDFLQALASLLERSLLNVATGQFLSVPDPPAFYLFEHAGVAVALVQYPSAAGSWGLQAPAHSGGNYTIAVYIQGQQA